MIKDEFLQLLDDPEVQARLRSAILDGGSLIDVRTRSHPDRPPVLLTAIEVPAHVSPEAVKAAVDAAVGPDPRTTRRGKDHVVAHVPWHPSYKGPKRLKPDPSQEGEPQ